MDFTDRTTSYTHEILTEQILWLIKLRWIVVGGIVVAALLGSYIFPVLSAPYLIYICAALLLVSNIIYMLLAKKNSENAEHFNIKFGMIQLETDLMILTLILHFSGGVVNPCFLFYIFYVIIAAIILPRNLSFTVGLTTIFCFVLLEINEFKGGTIFGYYPLQLSSIGGIWRNPVYALGVFASFSFTVMLAQFLTRMIIIRMTDKELEAARNGNVLKAIINGMSEGLIFVNDCGQMSICNPQAMQWNNGLSSDAQKESYDSFPAPLTEMIKNITMYGDKSNVSGQTISFETFPELGYVQAKCCPVIGVHGNYLGHVIVGQDLTEHKRLEEYLRNKTEEVANINELLKMSRIEMAQREKMVAIGQMATGIAHEIGNPLASISSVAQYLVRKLTHHQQKEQLLVIQYHVNRISNILKRMLGLSRPAASEYKWSDINSLIENTLSLISFDKRASRVRIIDNLNPDLPMLWLNPQHLEQVFLNVFINALDAMVAKGDRSDHCLTKTKESNHSIVEIRISDTGVGMNPQICKRAFESFFTTKEIGKGTGMGLYVSYNLIAEIDGTIQLESEPGNGTTVIIRIPVKPNKAMIKSNDEEDRFAEAC
ncbi:MAG: ATP-binding protein [Sedimentisphaerales bacterium]